MRRRLFEPLAGAEAFKQRDVTARAFAELYRGQAAELTKRNESVTVSSWIR